MAAIPSIGDILMLSQLAWKIGRAFTAGRKGAPAEFLEVESEINSLAKALKLLAEAMFAEADDSLLSKADRDVQAGVATILLSCQHTVHDIDSFVEQYQVIKKTRTAGGFVIDRSWSDLVMHTYRTMMWTSEGGNIQNLRVLLHMHTSTISLLKQALESKSLSRLERTVTPMADKVEHMDPTTSRSLGEQLEEVHRIVSEIASKVTPPQNQPATVLEESRPPSSLRLDAESVRSQTPRPNESAKPQVQPQEYPYSKPPSSFNIDLDSTPSTPHDVFPERHYYPSRRSSRTSIVPMSPTLAGTAPSSPKARVPEFSFGGNPNRYSGISYAGSDGGTNNSWSIPNDNRVSHLRINKREPPNSPLPPTPEFPGSMKKSDKGSTKSKSDQRSQHSRSDKGSLRSLPPPAMDETPDPDTISVEKLSLYPPTSPDIVKLHRSSTTASQRGLFEKMAFRNSAILCDVRGTMVEYTQKLSGDEENPLSLEVEMVEACKECRIKVVRKREVFPENDVRMVTSIWVFSDDNSVRLQQRLDEHQMYVPYSSYFSPEKVSVTVPCELVYHDVKFGTRPVKTSKTSWINYVLEDIRSSTLFQNELMSRSLLATFRTQKTLRIHEGLSGAFAYQEQMCGFENLRIWEDETSAAVIALIHFSAQFRNGYLAFYLNSSAVPIRVKDDGVREVKIKGLRVVLDEKGKRARKDSAEVDKKRVITGARIEFATEEERVSFTKLVKEVQKTMLELPDLVGV